MLIRLNVSEVRFEEVPHTYHLGDKQLHGVTGMLHAMLFKDKYAGIDEAVLSRAAEYGTKVHKAVETLDRQKVITGDCKDELMSYRQVCMNNDLLSVASEYTVSDNETIASQIDCVFLQDNRIILGDLKTTSGGLDKEYLSWQLSVYAYLFERQNPKLKVDGLCGIWLRHDKYGFAPIPRKTDADVEQLIADYKRVLAGEEIETTAGQVPAEVQNLAAGIQAVIQKRKDAEAQEAEMKEQLLRIMKENGCVKVELPQILLTYVAPASSERFDSASFKKAHPEMYTDFVKTTTVKESLKITIRN